MNMNIKMLLESATILLANEKIIKVLMKITIKLIINSHILNQQ